MVSSITQEQLLKTVRFPVQAYFVVISEFINNGPYQIKEDEFKDGYSGAISWNRTRKKVSPFVTEQGFIYPKYQVRQHSETDKNLITEISKFCAYESYLKLGWMYNLPLIQKPIRTREISEYKEYMNAMLLYATKDKDKTLFSAMKDILDFTNNQDQPEEFYFGTNRFEYIWERLIQATYGNENKEYYFPKTKWRLHIGKEKENKAIEPDTIMKFDNDVYVLDAKYYKYGITQLPQHLPESSSINKQISYEEYIMTHEKFAMERNQGMNVFNAFLMPYDSSNKPYDGDDSNYFSIGEGVTDWKDNLEDYHRVQGILVDVKYLMTNSIRPNYKEIQELSNQIIDSLNKNKGN
ncbi:LlaJI family restriction endonuclease [Aerococcaceae bacterium NML210727]|nr:LlaJI family restriction endonuclease [Aerococcaceae bacterium NML210727]MCW6653822.1 LlaJI family restriction endonuclease [Aerococcaceae bacterium NML201296]